MKKCKKSRFNYVSDTKNGIIIYNTLYNSLTRLSEEEYDVYLSEKYDNRFAALQVNLICRDYGLMRALTIRTV